MKIKKISTEKITFIVVPNNKQWHYWLDEENYMPQIMLVCETHTGVSDMNLTDGDNSKKEKFEILGNFSNLTEKQCEELVETIHIEIMPNPYNDMAGDWDVGFIDYLNVGEFAGWQGDAGAYRKAKESLKSLIISNNIWIKDWVYIFDESKDKRGLHLEFPIRSQIGADEYNGLPEDLLIIKIK
jgi:hypothetical protein